MTDNDKTTREKGEIGEIAYEPKHDGLPMKAAVPLVEKIAELTLQGTNAHFEVFKFQTGKGDLLQLAMSRSQAAKTGAVVNALLDAGIAYVALPVLTEAVTKAIGTRPKKTGTLVIVGGWTDGCVGREFVMSDLIIRGKKNGEASARPTTDVLYPCIGFNGKSAWNLVGKNGIAEGTALTFQKRGTLAEWKSNVAEPSLGSSRMMFCICAAFAAPILRILKVSPFTILISGPSTGGKTSSTLVAASVIGIGDELEFANWDVSEAGLEELARGHSDLLLPIDDLATAGNSPKELYRLVTTVPYRITAGSKRGRMQTAVTAISGRPAATKGIATIVLTSSEKTLAELAADAGGTIPDGIKVRFVEIPQAMSKEGGLFDRNPNIKSGQETKRQIEKITAVCAENHGVVFADWLRKLVNKPNAAKNYLKRARKEFLNGVEIDSKANLEFRHADRFSLVYAAGAYAIKLGLLPWKDGDLREAVMACFIASRKTLNPPDEMLLRGLRRLAKKLNDTRLFVSEGHSIDGENVCGTIRIVGTAREFAVRGEKFRSWFSSKTQQTRVEKFLINKKYLSRGADGKLTRQKEFPGIGRERCYVLRFPKEWTGF